MASTTISLTDQLDFALMLQDRLERANARSLARGAMTTDYAARDAERMDAIIATLRKCQMLKEVGDEMIARNQ